MTPRIHAWASIPSLAAIQAHLAQYPDSQHLIFCLPANHIIPQWQPENERSEFRRSQNEQSEFRRSQNEQNEFRRSQNATQQALAQAWQEATCCLVYDAVNYIRQWQPETDLWLLPPHAASHLHEHFPQPENIIWHTAPIAQQPAQPLKAWQQPPFRQPCPFVQISDLGIKGYAAAQRARLKTQSQPHVIIIGAGIAGAATAYECASRGARVTVLEASEPAQAASGNQQGLLYAKISPHLTAQTELLLAGYGYTRRLLKRLLPQQQSWRASGVLHLNHNESEAQRNAQLAQNQHYQHLYRPVSPSQASQIAGIPIAQSGLYWQHGAWLNPPALICALLRQPNIALHQHTPAQSIHHRDGQWHVQTPNGSFSGSHIVFCTGADNEHIPIIQHYPFQIIRGQTSVAPATEGSLKLKTALSAASYISPAWQGEHCYGATFAPNDPSRNWQAADEARNRQELAQLSPYLAQEFADYYAAHPIRQPENERSEFRRSQNERNAFQQNPNSNPNPTHDSGSLKTQMQPETQTPNHPKGHTATRCDCHDHLPAVGAISDPSALRQTYAAYALDKNYRIATACPYLPNAYANTAHGSRGLATAPICAAEIAAQICHTPRPLSERLRQALNPNRLIIRQIVRGKK